ncbi:hypothetical protein B0H16DRAFT_1885020 [Mycena metata]|uniref:Uncharacterized protein n=1 Tax=Mycena metata TaxID=1033252 RepID=A0AAD7J7W8_9AGAR|nr:hypothetical protein B0H16DRAFT_1885020 [Mycena metata]
MGYLAALRPQYLNMPNLPDGSLSILASPLPPATAAKIMLAIFGLLLIVASLHYASPTRLTRVLSDAMSDLDKVFIEVTTAGLLGLLSAEDMQAVVWTYQMLRIEVGTLQSDALRNSTSWCTSLYSVFTRSKRLFRCIKQVRDFQRRLQVLQKDHRNKTNSLPLSFATGTNVLQNKTPAPDHRRLPPPPSNRLPNKHNPNPNRKQNRAGRLPRRIPSPTVGPPSASGSGSNANTGYRQQGGGGYPSPPPPGPPVPPQGGGSNPYSEPSSMYGAPMNALRQPGPPVAPRDHREQRERERERERDRERDRDREREKEREQRERERERDRDRDREQRDRERDQLQMQRERERDRDREQQLRERERDPREFAPHSPHPSLAWQGGPPLPSAHGPPPPSQSQSQLAQVQQAQQQHQPGGPGVGLGLQTGPRAFQRQFHTSFVPVREASPPLPPASSSGRKASSASGGNVKREGGTAGMMLQRDAYGTWGPAMDEWEMGAANNANNANSSSNAGFNSGGSTNAGAFGIGVGHPNVGIDTRPVNTDRWHVPHVPADSIQI